LKGGVHKLSTNDNILNEIITFNARSIFYNPIIRKIVHGMFYQKLLISTFPTAKGKSELDMYHMDYSIKRIEARPISKLESTLTDIFLNF
jgi:hypothetical protein